MQPLQGSPHARGSEHRSHVLPLPPPGYSLKGWRDAGMFWGPLIFLTGKRSHPLNHYLVKNKVVPAPDVFTV